MNQTLTITNFKDLNKEEKNDILSCIHLYINNKNDIVESYNNLYVNKFNHINIMGQHCIQDIVAGITGEFQIKNSIKY
jgi:hypothetical protein